MVSNAKNLHALDPYELSKYDSTITELLKIVSALKLRKVWNTSVLRVLFSETTKITSCVPVFVYLSISERTAMGHQL